MIAQQLDLFQNSLPKRPYCTDELGGLLIRQASSALKHRYIQHNPPPLLTWLVFDIDRADSVFAWDDAGLPAPAWVATNPDNGHCHISYGLLAPVARTDAARAAPLRLAAAVEYAYRTALGADRGYAGLITKNPMHEHWLVFTPSNDSGVYDLATLAEYVTLPKRIPKREREAGVGRNVEIFDNLRAWSYSAVRQYWRPDGYNAWLSACIDRASELNQFASPLPFQEVQGIGKSVAKWVWQHFTPAGFREVQSNRGKLGGRPALGEPWQALGISRATYFRRRSAGLIVSE